MKYSQFIELKEVLNENNITIDDIKENHDVLNEIGLTTALIGGGLLGLVSIFRKGLLRLGLKKYYLIRLNNIAKKFKETLVKDAQKMAKNMMDAREKINDKEQGFKDANDNSSSEFKSFSLQKKRYEYKMYDYGIKRINKLVEKKTKQVEKMIEESTRLKDSQKLALEFYWDSLVPHIELPAMNIFIEKGIITNEEIIDRMNKNFKKEKEELSQKFNNFTNKVEGKESEGDSSDSEVKQSALKKDDL